MKKVVILGPESVGKTTLCNYLSDKVNAVILPEYAREYVEKLNRPYRYSDVEHIAKHQIASLKKASEQHIDKNFIIMDTFLIVTKVWFTYVYKRYPKWLDAELQNANIDLFLLLKPDIEWEEDSVRENPHIREYLYNCYKKELDDINANYVEIEGVGQIRVKRALRAINKLIKE